MEIDIVVHFYGVMKLSEHGQNCQLSYFDHSGYHYINLSFNWQTFATCLTHFMKCQKKDIIIFVISDINEVVHPNIS